MSVPKEFAIEVSPVEVCGFSPWRQQQRRREDGGHAYSWIVEMAPLPCEPDQGCFRSQRGLILPPGREPDLRGAPELNFLPDEAPPENLPLDGRPPGLPAGLLPNVLPGGLDGRASKLPPESPLRRNGGRSSRLKGGLGPLSNVGLLWRSKAGPPLLNPD
jgi:hypothetical protein